MGWRSVRICHLPECSLFKIPLYFFCGILLLHKTRPAFSRVVWSWSLDAEPRPLSSPARPRGVVPWLVWLSPPHARRARGLALKDEPAVAVSSAA